MDEAYLYSLWSGRLIVYKGSVDARTFLDNGSFYTENPKKKRMQCSKEPKIVHNSVVWLTERNDKEAVDILVAYEKSMVFALQEKINNHLHKIKILNESLLKGESL